MTKLALRSNVHVLLRDARFLQIGIHPARSVMVPHEAQEILDMLNGCYSYAEIVDAFATQYPETPVVIQALLNSDLVVECPSKSLDIELSDVQRLNHTRETHGRHNLAMNRITTEISIYGAGRLGTTIALLFCSSGYPNIRVHDDRPVTSDDIIAWGAGRLDIGQRRDRVCGLLMERLSRGALSRQLHPRTSTPKKLSIYVLDSTSDWPWFDPLAVEKMNGNESDHIVVNSSHDMIRWSSVITPSASPCVRCEYQRIVDRDAQWPIVTQQLRSRALLDLAPAGLVIAGASNIVSDVNEWLSDENTQSGATTLSWPALDRDFAEWSFHPACGCDWMNESRVA